MFSEKMAQLKEKQETLRVVQEKLDKLNEDLVQKEQERQNLSENIELTKLKLVRAEKLISGLGGEKDRWQQLVQDLTLTYDNIVGDVLLSAGVVAYLGPFVVAYRQVRLRFSLYL